MGKRSLLSRDVRENSRFAPPALDRAYALRYDSTGCNDAIGMIMTVVIQQEHEAVQIPDWVRDLNSFRRWAKSDDFPEQGWYAHLGGKLWVDPSMERLAHNKLKSKVNAVLTPLAEGLDAGQFFGDRMLLTNVEADLSTEPDGMFVSHSAVAEGRVRLEQGDDCVEVEGSPDMVLEVVSPTSVQKDTVVLRELYFRAGVTEYWLADPRRAGLTFEILKRGPKGFVATRKHEGWIKLAVFGKSFHLSRKDHPQGYPIFLLDVR
jgi:Uma2 family endonuclease